MEFFVNNLPTILCLLIGLVLIVIEMFLPGFGFVGFSGILLLGGAVAFTWINYGAMAGSLMMIAVLVLTIICLVVSLRSASKGKLSRSKVFLKEDGTTGETVKAEAELNVGDTGVAETMLRPAGIALFDTRRVSVVSEGQFIDKGKTVHVVQIEGARIVVEEE